MNKTETANLPLAVTMGDPAGVGPEIVSLALEQEPFASYCLVVGNLERLREGAEIAGASTEYVAIEKAEDAFTLKGDAVPVLEIPIEDPQLDFGELSAAAGKCAYQCLIKAIDLAMDKKVSAVVTAPLNKGSLNLAGYKYPGHTEILGERTGVGETVMMLAADGMRVLHATTHLPLAKVPTTLTSERIVFTLKVGHDALVRMGVRSPRFGIAGLNPHAGEGGIFGDEEEKIIIPAMEEARSMGIYVDGPVPPDVVFLKMHGGKYDAVVAMYHDQGHIPLKLLAFESGVNVTLGLPIIRTSVDHGTAFDIAGKGLADPGSLVEALRLAIRMAESGI
jgi:4-hydroxythreonine-4-phosphate dehydrogenase